MPPKDLYRVLGVSRTASSSEIRSAYRRSLLRYHPDQYRGDPDIAQSNTRALADAYDVLGDEDRRRAYDLSIEEPSYVPPTVPPPVHRPRSSSNTVRNGHVRVRVARKSIRHRPVDSWLVNEWVESAHRFRPTLGRDPRIERMLLVFGVLALLCAAAAVALA
jgi:curved DNA-binding protein CbpA